MKIISATNRNIEKMVEQKKFRSDLYYRLNTYQIHMPLLKERPGDIPELILHFLSLLGKEFNRVMPLVQQQAMDELSRYSWPGNVRELKNVVERLVLVSKGREITQSMVASLINKGTPLESREEKPFEKKLFSHEKELIEQALISCGWNISKTARTLGITRNTLRYRIKKHKLGPGL
ncbi:MAG: sigma-54-dependent Fis family transcriptional regulator [Deltaproteobacteria bacterium]|nr:sigma-54-dependent Fis family transcriptional regulator [Deltaproteobacteria bacterium]